MEADPRHEIFTKVADDVAEGVMRAFREPPLDPTPVPLDAYPHLDRAWYRKATKQLEALGFRVVRDLDGRKAMSPKAPPPLVRVMLSADGKTSAALYHLKPAPPEASWFVKLLTWLLGKWPPSPRVVECMSYEGTRALSTSNQGNTNVFQPQPGCIRGTLPLGASIEAVVAEHAERLKAEGFTPDVITDFDQLQVRRNAWLERMRAWRADVGLLPAELDAMVAPHGDFGAQLKPYIERAVAARRAQ